MIGFWIASALAALTLGIHGFVGTKEVKSPLLGSPIQDGPKYTVYLCWHIVTVMFAVMALGFAWAALGAWDVGVTMTILALATGAWALALQVSSGLAFKDLPQWSLMFAIAGAGLWGSFSA